MYRVILEELNDTHCLSTYLKELYRSEELGLCIAYCCANRPDSKSWTKLTIQKEVTCWKNVEGEY